MPIATKPEPPKQYAVLTPKPATPTKKPTATPTNYSGKPNNVPAPKPATPTKPTATPTTYVRDSSATSGKTGNVPAPKPATPPKKLSSAQGVKPAKSPTASSKGVSTNGAADLAQGNLAQATGLQDYIEGQQSQQAIDQAALSQAQAANADTAATATPGATPTPGATATSSGTGLLSSLTSGTGRIILVLVVVGGGGYYFYRRSRK